MSQATLDDDDLFGEAADELRADIDVAVEEAYDALPDAETVWNPPGDNLLGQLNSLRSTLDVEAAREHVREAKKWREVGTRSGAIDEDDPIVEQVDDLEETLARFEETADAAADLTSALPVLRELLAED